MKVRYTRHARERMQQRHISSDHIEAVVGMLNPSTVKMNHQVKRWSVVLDRKQDCWLVVTAYQ
jgi:hypothetical protein